LVDTNDWEMKEDSWQALNMVFPGLEVDRFASVENAKLPVFNTRWAHPESWTYNAMAQDWSKSFSYACPPLAMVGPVLDLIREQRARAVVVVPEWHAQRWWPLLQSMKVFSYKLGTGKEVFQAGQSKSVPAPHKRDEWQFLAVEVDGKLIEERRRQISLTSYQKSK
jgi:hypothetical protein